ncbi:MAG: hypothetical protein SFY96_02905 [Planctomycetota bacterium]|nr:hypothetical protein [Planctomycetota bacterium]
MGATPILPSSWTVILLPPPKRFCSSKAIGFCAGWVLGTARTSAGKSAACWWPAGEPTLLSLPPHKELSVVAADGKCAAGSWSKSKSGRRGAVAWRAQGGSLIGRDLHDPRFETSWATGVGGDLIVGVGTHKGKLGKAPPASGLVWRSSGKLIQINADRDVCLSATDGTRIAGTIDGRATLWPSFESSPIDLAPDRTPASEVRAIDADTQIGYGFDRHGARALVWRGSPDSVVDLTPKGFQEARAFAGTCGFQVGFIRPRATTKDGIAASEDRAVIWNSSAEHWVDLNALLPAPFNASIAWAIRIDGDVIEVCGEALQVRLKHTGTSDTPPELKEPLAILWRGRLAPSPKPATKADITTPRRQRATKGAA